MSERYIFHLAFPVSDLAATKEFYVGLLGADVGRENAEWLDILLWGHQITLHQRPDDVLARERQGKRHFGVILPWSEWQQLVEHLRAREVVFLQRPEILLAGTPQEQAKFYLEDLTNSFPKRNECDRKRDSACRDDHHMNYPPLPSDGVSNSPSDLRCLDTVEISVLSSPCVTHLLYLLDLMQPLALFSFDF